VRDASIACRRSSTSAAACSRSVEFDRFASEASTDCKRPNTFANNADSSGETPVREALLTSPVAELRLSSTGRTEVARDASTALKRSEILASLFCNEETVLSKRSRLSVIECSMVSSRGGTLESHSGSSRATLGMDGLLRLSTAERLLSAIPCDELDKAASDASMASKRSYSPASNTGVLGSKFEIDVSILCNRPATSSSSFCRAFWCREATYIRSCCSSSAVTVTVPGGMSPRCCKLLCTAVNAFSMAMRHSSSPSEIKSTRFDKSTTASSTALKRSCALVVSRGGLALARNISRVCNLASRPASRCRSTESDNAATEDSMVRSLSGKMESQSGFSLTASWPDSRCCTLFCAAKCDASTPAIRVSNPCTNAWTR